MRVGDTVKWMETTGVILKMGDGRTGYTVDEILLKFPDNPFHMWVNAEDVTYVGSPDATIMNWLDNLCTE